MLRQVIMVNDVENKHLANNHPPQLLNSIELLYSSEAIKWA